MPVALLRCLDCSSHSLLGLCLLDSLKHRAGCSMSRHAENKQILYDIVWIVMDSPDNSHYFSDMRVSNSSRKLQKNSPDQEIIEEHSTLASS